MLANETDHVWIHDSTKSEFNSDEKCQIFEHKVFKKQKAVKCQNLQTIAC